MRDYGGFGDPASKKTALLIECGQHWERRSAEVATDVMLRFLVALDCVTRDEVAALGGPDFAAHPRQRVIEVTEAVTITGERFDFTEDYRGLEVLPEKGTLIGRDDGKRGAHALRQLRPDHAVAPARPRPDGGAPRAIRRLTTAGTNRAPPRPGAAFRRLSTSARGSSCSARCRVKNRCAGVEYYAHPRNLFWPIVCGLFGDNAAMPPTPKAAFSREPADRSVGRLRSRRAPGERRCDDPRRGPERDRRAARRPPGDPRDRVQRQRRTAPLPSPFRARGPSSFISRCRRPARPMQGSASPTSSTAGARCAMCWAPSERVRLTAGSPPPSRRNSVSAAPNRSISASRR